MDEDDHDELLQCSDEDSLSESEDQCIPIDKPEEIHTDVLTYTSHTKTEFFFVKSLLIFSTTALLILLPIYQESINVKGNAYALIYFNSTMAVIILLMLLFLVKKFSESYTNLNIARPPLKPLEIFAAGFIYTLSGFIIIYSVDRKKVMCHLQDPMKGLVLVFSLIYYFFFCKKLMGLQRIFSTTTIIVGLFISVDYGLCNEFRCRGNDREHKSDDAGIWTWQAHSIWATVYIVGLALFSAFYMLLDRLLVTSVTPSPHVSLSSQFLTTVSRLVSSQSTSSIGNSSQTLPLTLSRTKKKFCSSLLLAFWIHIFSWIVTVALFWTDILPNVGKSTNITEFFNQTAYGLVCIVSPPEFGHSNENNCGNTSIYAWLFLFAYLTFSVTSIRFLILSQSAVYTIATATVSLPLTEIWWSLFKLTTIQKGLLVWSPSLSGELICALLGFPIVIIGLALLCKSHFKISHMPNNCIGSTQLT